MLTLLLGAAGCPGKAPSAADSPAYSGANVEAPSAPRVGETYVYDLLGGSQRRDEVLSVDGGVVRIERVVKMKDGVAHVTTVTEALAGPSPSASVPDGSDFKVVREETLTVSGRSFPCSVREVALRNSKVDEWVATRWPFVLKTRSDPFTSLELVAIEEKK